MSGGADDESEAERRLRSELDAHDEELARLKQVVQDEARMIESLRGSQGEDAAKTGSELRAGSEAPETIATAPLC